MPVISRVLLSNLGKSNCLNSLASLLAPADFQCRSYTLRVDNPYVELTEAFNRERLRAILSSGQAVVLYRLAIMSKDGDWILREDEEALAHVLDVLGQRGARYRFGAPLDVRWLAGGWSSHLEHRQEGLRLRTDFVTRPPRMSAEQLDETWRHPVDQGVPVIGLEELAEIKKTNREKDYPVIGELARRMNDPRSQLLYSRSSRDLDRLAVDFPEALEETLSERPLLSKLGKGREVVERALDEERREMIRANEERLARYTSAAQEWAAIWPEISKATVDCPLAEAHVMLAERAESVLPFEV